MTAIKFNFSECSDPDCRLRFPLDSKLHKGAFCPLCGAPAAIVEQVHSHPATLSVTHPQYMHMEGLLDNFRSALNVGSAFRIADGAGLAHLYLCGITPSPAENTSISKTALGAEGYVPWSHHRNALDLIQTLKTQGTLLIGLESTPTAVSLFDLRLDLDQVTHQRIVLAVGSETAGLDPGILALCDYVIFLPMRGRKESLNAAVAFGIAAYWLTRS